VCVCDSNQGLFSSPENSVCNQCGSFNSVSLGLVTADCALCYVGTGVASVSTGFECKTCNAGFYLTASGCAPCQTGCSKCTGPSSCYLCDSPAYIYSSGICICNEQGGYFPNGTICERCAIGNCTICFNLTQCSICLTGFFLNAGLVCQEEICGDGLVHGT
jgi:hypothetical protein